MPVYVRYIDLNGCKNSYCIPEKPNGYAIFMLLDYQTLHSGHAEHFIDPFVKKGYTVFSSGLLIAEWGSKKAVKHAEHLIQLLLRQETINEKIFLCAEGTGALIAQQLCCSDDIHIRAAAFINPLLSLEDCFLHYQDDEVTLKRFKKEMSRQYGLKHCDRKIVANLDKKLFTAYHLPVQSFLQNVKRDSAEESTKVNLSRTRTLANELSGFYQTFISAT
ncbi:hypothetical protein [Shouchella miscanthi]|uniref:hypothetical protein n=1 Tax=Shouchella miscanthi TaxID=2598861 RepID=UPI0011AA0EC5|nr:hypothetical protein [Shouchella miscanthi]